MSQTKKEKEIVEEINKKIDDLTKKIEDIEEGVGKCPENAIPALFWWISDHFKQFVIVLAIAASTVMVLSTGIKISVKDGSLEGFEIDKVAIKSIAEATEVIKRKKVKSTPRRRVRNTSRRMRTNNPGAREVKDINGTK